MIKNIFETFRLVTLHIRGVHAIALYTVLVIMAVPPVVAFLFAPWFFGVLGFFAYFSAAILYLRKALDVARLQLSEQFETKEFSALVDYLPEGVILYDPSFKVLSFNKAAQELFRLSAEEIVGRMMDPGMAKNPHYRILVQALFPSLAPSMTQVSTSEAWPQIVDLTTDEPVLELRSTLIRLTDEGQNAIGFLRLVKDRTREKALLAEKTDFINVAAHQLRTPLTAMGWAMESLVNLTADSSADVKEIVKEGNEIAQRALKITNDLLDVAKIEEGKFGFLFEEKDIAELIQQLVSASGSIAKQYSVTLFMEPPKESIVVRMDPAKLSSVFLNLLDNAIRYNVKNGRVVIAVDRLMDKPFVKISVEDTGIGVPSEEIGELFTKLHRGSNAAVAEPNGSGLGLYIAKNIVEQHGGSIGFESTLNRGSTFWFTLPLKK
ncbi:MAG: HAMP domain-containing sensor histidine kinase [Patescibacteria group bacterium]